MKIWTLCFALLLGFANCQSKQEAIDVEKAPLRYLALGDSYTIGESVSESSRWPVQLRDSLIARGETFDDFQIIATTGWRTDDLFKAIDEANLENEFNLVSLLIGVNNQYQGKSVDSYKPEFEVLLGRAITLAGGDKANVFVVSIPDYAYTPFGQKADSEKITRELESYNEACKELTVAKGVKHIDITLISKDGVVKPELVADDGLHPSAAQYTLWVEKILEDMY